MTSDNSFHSSSWKKRDRINPYPSQNLQFSYLEEPFLPLLSYSDGNSIVEYLAYFGKWWMHLPLKHSSASFCWIFYCSDLTFASHGPSLHFGAIEPCKILMLQSSIWTLLLSYHSSELINQDCLLKNDCD